MHSTLGRNLPHMDFSRRRLLRTGAATAAATGVALAAGTAAHAAQTQEEASAQEPLRGRETALDLEQKQVNPANQLGCPLGKGE